MTSNEGEQDAIEVVYSQATIQQQISLLASQIAADNLKELLVVAVLKGSFVFAADLIRALHEKGLSPQVDFLSLSSYKDGTKSTGRVEILKDIDLSVEGRDVLLVDDILESGRTMHFASELLKSRGAGKIKTCVLLDKPGHRAAQIDADYRAFECPDVFVIGYGMDKAYKYRELPYVGRIVE